jgi:hypothetical protein
MHYKGQRLSINFSTTTRPAGHVPSVLEILRRHGRLELALGARRR